MERKDKLPEKLLKWEEILKPGTPFWHICYYSEQKEIKCPVCKGKEVIKLEGKEYECPECYGSGVKRITQPTEWHVDALPWRDYCVVTRVEAEQTKKDDYYKVMYWDGANGFPAEVVFTSKNKATRKCNELNKKLREVKDEVTL